MGERTGSRDVPWVVVAGAKYAEFWQPWSLGNGMMSSGKWDTSNAGKTGYLRT